MTLSAHYSDGEDPEEMLIVFVLIMVVMKILTVVMMVLVMIMAMTTIKVMIVMLMVTVVMMTKTMILTADKWGHHTHIGKTHDKLHRSTQGGPKTLKRMTVDNDDFVEMKG